MTRFGRQRRYYIEIAFELLAVAARQGRSQQRVTVQLPGHAEPWLMTVEEACRGMHGSTLHLLTDEPYARAEAYHRVVVAALGADAQRQIHAWHDMEDHYARLHATARKDAS